MLVPYTRNALDYMIKLFGVVGPRAQVSEDIVCTHRFGADVDLRCDGGGWVEGYVYEGGGGGEGCAVEIRNAFCNGGLLRG